MHLITRFIGGGAERTTHNTLQALASAEHEYELHLGTGAAYDPDALAAVPDAETVVFRSLRHYNPVSAPVAVLAIRRYLVTHDIDVLHTHSTEAGIVGRVAGALADTPVVIHEVHGDPVASDRNPLLNLTVLAAERVTAPLADRMVVVADRLAELYLDRGIGEPDQYVRIYDGVDLDRFAPEAGAGTTGSPDQVRLVFVGRLADGKGLFDLLDAVDRLTTAGADIHLDVVGEGPLAARLTETIEARDIPVSLLGYRDNVPALLSRSDVLVLPSYREGTPRVISEAMAAGLPVVSTAIAGIPEQVDDAETGYLVDPGDIDGLTDRLERLIRDADRRREFGERAQERAARFDRARAQERYRTLYRRVRPQG